MGYLAYDLKNEVEPHLTSQNADNLGFDDMCFFEPDFLVVSQKNTVKIIKNKDNFTAFDVKNPLTPPKKQAEITAKCAVSKEEYIKKINEIKQHIADGTVYELNYCMQFLAKNAVINPFETYKKLNEIAPAPFGAYLKLKDKYLLCGSPERFLHRKGSMLLSQPIKGTAARSPQPDIDAAAKRQLHHDPKERAENVMIVDLVRNDLAKSSVAGTVKVANLYKVYGFSKVFQMIGSVRSKKLPHISSATAIKNAFPMGSMTGAPKIKAMELIEQLECTKRGIYAGAVGYFMPNDNFDFNVVIRSIAYNQATQTLAYQVGGAITYDSQPEAEYQECMLKAESMQKALKN
jgi:para-aminobenzoate synthetase component 1